VDNPNLLTDKTRAMLWMIGGALALPLVVNRWIEHKPSKDAREGTDNAH
jgi:hypothetical protein